MTPCHSPSTLAAALVLLLAVASSTVSATPQQACGPAPELVSMACNCRFRGSDYRFPSVNCSSRGLTEFPILPTSVESIDLSYNSLTFIPSGAFVGFASLLTLDANYNQITSIAAGAFEPGTVLAGISFYYNNLTTIPVDFASGGNFSSVGSIFLMGNKITTVGPNAFGATFSGLTYLGLNLNPITSMADSAFSGAPNIGGLPLNDMLLTSLPVGALSSLKLLMLLAVRTPIQAISEDFRAPFATVVLFDSNQLSTLPSNMGTIFPSASQLAISNNLFESVPYEVSNMPNLGILSVDGNRIRSLQNQLTLTNLIGLTANHNQLTSLTVSDLVGYPNLMALQAANNSISYIEPGLLSSRPNMLYMMLANNSLTTLPPGLYQGSTSALLQNPTYNRLDGNPFIGQPPSTWGTVAQPIPCNAQCATCFAGTSSDCCPANCLQCTSNTTCNVCYDGYEKMGGVCAINYHAISTSVDAVASALAASVASVESVASIASVASVESAVSVASVASAVSAASVSSASVAAVAASLESVASVESVASAASVQSVLAVAASLESLLASQSAMSLASVASVASIQAIAPSSSEAAVLATSSTHAAALVSSAAATTGTTASGGLASNASASSGSSIGIVIGCVVGGVVLLLLLIVLISRRRSRKTKLVHHYDRDNGIVAEEVSYARIAGASLNKDSDTPIYDSTTPQVTYAQVNDAPHVYASTNAAHYDVLSTESKQVANYDVLSPQQANYEEIRTSSVKVV